MGATLDRRSVARAEKGWRQDKIRGESGGTRIFSYQVYNILEYIMELSLDQKMVLL